MGVKGGLEAAIHATRAVKQNRITGQLTGYLQNSS